jgi:peptide/nickel transport system permease protein
MMRIIPGDPILLLLTPEQLHESSEAELQLIRHEYDLDKPLVMQYFDWLSGAVHGDLGKSYFQNIPVMDLIDQSLPVTLHLGLLALVVGNLIGISAGLISAMRRGQWLDMVSTVVANIGITIPVFWLGFLLIYIFALKAGVLPVYGYTSPFDDFLLSTKQLIMPVICLSIFVMASSARQTRTAMLEVLRQDYIRMAFAKGLKERTVIIRHALKNAIIPVITLNGVTFRYVIGGSVLVETVFNIPGMGRLTMESILSHDYLVVQGIIIFVAMMVSLVNFLVDLSFGWIDPRIIYS